MSPARQAPGIVFSVSEEPKDGGIDEDMEVEAVSGRMRDGRKKSPMETLPLFSRESRYSTTSKVSIGSRPSFSTANMSSRPSMASLR